MENNIDDGRENSTGSVFDGDAKNTSWFSFVLFSFF